MKSTKLFLTTAFIGSLIILTSCGGDNDNTLTCLNCAEPGFPICEGDIDPDNGLRLTKRDLKLAKAVFEDIGLECVWE